MAQLDPDRYKRLTRGNSAYGRDDGLFWDNTNSQVVVVLNDAIVARIDATGITADLEYSGETRGDIQRRSATAWERHVALTTGQVLMGNGTDVLSQAISGDVALSGAGLATVTDLTLASEARGDVIRRNAAAWGVLVAKTLNQFLVGDGTDLVSAAFTAAMLPTNLKTGFIPLDIGSLRIIASDAIGNTAEGMLLDGNTAPSLQRVNSATDKALRVIWAATSVIELQFPPIPYPPDLDDTANVEVHVLIGKDTNTDNAAVVEVQAWEGLGDTEMGGNTEALATATITEYSVALAAANIAAQPNFLNVGLVPGTHNTEAIHLYAAWLEYKRRS